LAATLGAGVAMAQPAAMVADIQAPEAARLTPPWIGDLWMTDFVVLGGLAVMNLDDGIHGREVWVSDGTADGSRLLRDICPGTCDSRPRGFALLAGAVYFNADDGARGAELWRTDGTAAGTQLVADLAPGPTSGNPWGLAASNGLLYFSAALAAGSGGAFWRSDGSAAGTFPLTLASANPYAYDYDVVSLGSATAGFVFSFADAEHGREPWITDGTVSGTHLLVDLQPGVGGSLWPTLPFRGGADLVAVDGKVIFVADDGTHGEEVWASDGTVVGTLRLSTGAPGSGPSSPVRLQVASGKVYFGASTATNGRELWVTDGTVAGTQQLTDLGPGLENAVGLWYVSAFQGGALFAAGNSASGAELWRTDGTPEGTVLVKEVRPGPNGGLVPWEFAGCFVVGSRAYFVANDGVHGAEPWVTDGTEAGTQLLVDASVGAGPDDPENGSVNIIGGGFDRPSVVGERLLFRLFPRLRTNELWSTDGTPAGTSRVAIVNPGGSAVTSRVAEEPWPGGDLGIAGTKILFAADSGATGAELWSSAASGETNLLADLDEEVDVDLPNGSNPRRFVPLADRSLFSYTTYVSETNTWTTHVGASDGTVPGTFELTTSPGGWIDSAVRFGDELVYSADGTLARTDGSLAGTAALPCGCVGAFGLLRFGDHLLFRAEGSAGSEPWAMDLTADTPYPLADIEPGAGHSLPEMLGVAGDWALFSAETLATGRELWRTDGTPEGTSPLAELAPGTASALSSPWQQAYGARAVGVSGRLYFPATDSADGYELWRSDGTVSGTLQVRDLQLGPLGADPRWLTALGDRVLFSADDGLHGRELWASDGTEEGTFLLRDLWPGPESGQPQRLTVVDGVVVFAATDGVHGLELWRTDGTPVGTMQLQDLAPGVAASSPMAFTRAGGRLYFLATDAAHGFELWSLDLARLHALELFRDDFETATVGRWSAATP
jgi:ELWxxDGT repeat protein